MYRVWSLKWSCYSASVGVHLAKNQNVIRNEQPLTLTGMLVTAWHSVLHEVRVQIRNIIMKTLTSNQLYYISINMFYIKTYSLSSQIKVASVKSKKETISLVDAGSGNIKMKKNGWDG